MSSQPLVSPTAAPRSRRSALAALARGLGLALAPMLLFLSIPVGLSGGFLIAWVLLVSSLILITMEAALFGPTAR